MSKRKFFYFIDASEYLYCVAMKDLLSADPTSVKVEDTVSFKYGRLTLEGSVRLISADEKEILDAIKKEKKKKKKKERSFHAELKRPSKLRPPLDSASDQLCPGTMTQDDVNVPEVSKASAKKEKDILKKHAKQVTEVALAQDMNAGSPQAASADLAPSDETKSSSDSSVDATLNKHNDGMRSDLKDLMDAGMSSHSDYEATATPSCPAAHEQTLNLEDIAVSDVSTEPVESDISKRSTTGHKRRRSSSSDSSSSSSSTSSSSDSSSSSSSSSEEERRRKNKRQKKKSKGKSKSKSKKRNKKITRNLMVFPGDNFRWSPTDPGVVKVHEEFDVYIKKSELDYALQAKSPQIFIKQLVSAVFTEEALRGSTAQGYPPRSVGRKRLRQRDVLPRLDPDGRRAILRRAEDLESEKKSWRPRIGSSAMNQAFTAAVGAYSSD